MQHSSEFEPFFLAKGGPPMSRAGSQHPGTPFAPIDGDSHAYFFYTDGYEFDWLYGTMGGKDIYTRHFDRFLRDIQPDVVHVQHTLHLGYDLLRQIKTTLPNAVIVYTLHELLPICHRQGQMVRTVNNEELCDRESPRRCHECFPSISPQTFFMRKRFVQSHFSLVDLFIAPSRFLLERYLGWGIPQEKIRFEEYGRSSMLQEQDDTDEANRPRNRFGFFGQLTPFKGVHILLEAMDLLVKDRAKSLVHSSKRSQWDVWSEPEAPSEPPQEEPHLWLHGANLDFTSSGFQNQFNQLLENASDYVTMVGRYDHKNLPRLMKRVDWVVVPSIWWENSPLVIQEAFMHGRPVICSDIGGMAEKVTHGVNGLHFRVGDPESLALTIRQATDTHGLWEKLRYGIPQIYPMDDHIRELTGIYRTLSSQSLQTR